MDIKQAKQQFTELTGFKATAYHVYYYAAKHQDLQLALTHVVDNCTTCGVDARSTEFWVLLVHNLRSQYGIGVTANVL